MSLDLDSLNDKSLEDLFQKAYKMVSETTYVFKQDTLLLFYSYYKQATLENHTIRITNVPVSGDELVNAFKANALFQVRHLNRKEAKKHYILLASEYLDFV
ncbi:acyl-CoA-binding protein [Psychroflexus halocasei]|uniref:Acyl-CoA-binding protein n=1 Tax=Psychroflexus halocasei TaxID=908615 RepID=A0A1H3WPX7_9FLAO|nr:acyl-CoA-binding protein [Psychroflexus halocasei]SDZ89185.1 Acyl-CoA-binding protein [Psychroflexus halocasei]